MSAHAFASHSTLSVIAGIGVFMLAGLLAQASQLWYQPRVVVPLLFGLGLALVGIAFKIEHWAGTNWLLTVGAVVMSASYLGWFWGKSTKTVLCCLKLALLLSVGCYFLALAWWQPGVMPAMGVGRLAFWSVALLYVYQRWVQTSRQTSR